VEDKSGKERGTPYWLMLRNIRNDVMFHFYPGEIEKNLDNVAVADEVNFAVSRTSQKKDVVYTLSDQILWRYVFDRKGIEGNTAMERIEGLATYLTATTEAFIGTIDLILIELLKPLGAGIKRKVYE
jgi:hypothetical protein